MHVTICFDGGCQGNPGRTASSAIVIDDQGETIAHACTSRDHATNNVAELDALELGLSTALQHGATSADVYGDSMLAITKVFSSRSGGDPHLEEIATRCRELAGRFQYIRGRHIRRERNDAADTVGKYFFAGRYIETTSTAHAAFTFVAKVVTDEAAIATTPQRSNLKNAIQGAIDKALPVAGTFNVVRTSTKPYVAGGRAEIGFIIDATLRTPDTIDRRALRNALRQAISSSATTVHEARVVRVSG